MRTRNLVGGLGAAALVVASLAAAQSAASASGNAAQPPAPTSRLCTMHPAKGQATCYAEIAMHGQGGKARSAQPAGAALTPAQLEDAYKIAGLASGGRTVAIVDASATPTSSETSVSTAATSVFPRVRRPTGVCGSWTRTAAANCPASTPAGPVSRRSTSTRCRQRARTATSSWSKPPARRSGTSVRRSSPLRPSLESPRSRTATAVVTPPMRPTAPTTTTRTSR